MKPRRPRAHHICGPHTIPSIHETQSMPIQSRHGPCVASTSIASVSEATRDIDLFFQRHLRDESASFGVSTPPEALAVSFSCDKLAYVSQSLVVRFWFHVTILTSWIYRRRNCQCRGAKRRNRKQDRSHIDTAWNTVLTLPKE